MNTDRDPPRLRRLQSELSSELLLALEDAPGGNATPEELAALSRQLRAALHERAPSSRRPSSLPRKARGPLAAVMLTFTLGAVAGIAASGGVFLVMRERAPEPPPSAVATASPPAQTAKPLAPPSTASATPTPDDEAPTPAASQPRELARFPAPASSADTDPASLAAAENRDELALLARAQAALANSPTTALALATDHQRLFEDGALAQEREVVAIDALLRLGRRAEATGRAIRFHEQFPTSVHGRRVDVLFGRSDSSRLDHN